MTYNGLKDIGIELTNDSMFNIIKYQDNNIHPILQAAITLIFFTNDVELRNDYNGLYHIIGSSNNNIIDNLEMDLVDLGFKLLDKLKPVYPEISKITVTPIISREQLQITLDIAVQDQLLTTTIYKEYL